MNKPKTLNKKFVISALNRNLILLNNLIENIMVECTENEMNNTHLFQNDIHGYDIIIKSIQEKSTIYGSLNDINRLMEINDHALHALSTAIHQHKSELRKILASNHKILIDLCEISNLIKETNDLNTLYNSF